MHQFFLFIFISVLASTNVSAVENAKPLTVRMAPVDCIATLDNLIYVTSSATSLTGKEQQGLVKIASDARNLYVTGKTADAVKKVNDYQVKLDQLAITLSNPKPKISNSDEQALRTALNEANACVSAP